MKWYLRLAVLGVVLCVLIDLTVSEEITRTRRITGRRVKGERKRGQKCSEWVYTKCMPAEGKCGKGTRIGNRDGEKCTVKQRMFPCTIPCTSRKPRNNKKNGKFNAKVCRYSKSAWSDCVDGKKTRHLTLRKNHALTCQPTKIKTKKCRSKDGKKTKTKTTANKRCKYSLTHLGACDMTSDTQNATFVLKEGSPSTCERSRVVVRKCTRTCRYVPGNWSECDTLTKISTRVDILNAARSKGDNCKATRTVSKMCKTKGIVCRYQKGAWTDKCDDKNERTLSRTLLPDQPKGCPPVKTVKRSCIVKTGRERCFFGPWGKYGPCQNGVKTKVRPLVSGGESCERKAVKTKMC